MILTMGMWNDLWVLYLQTKGHLSPVHVGSKEEVLALYDDLWQSVLAFEGGMHLQ